MKPFFLYILRCADGRLYVGHTDDVDRRVAEHQAGLHPGWTKSRRPVTVAFVDEFPTRAEALERERQIKGWTRAKKEALIAGDWLRIGQLARGTDRTPVRPSTTRGSSDGPGGESALRSGRTGSNRRSLRDR